jgi:hypothetical protein
VPDELDDRHCLLQAGLEGRHTWTLITTSVGCQRSIARWLVSRQLPSREDKNVFSLVAMQAGVPIDGWFPAKPLGRPNRRDLVAPHLINGRP